MKSNVLFGVISFEVGIKLLKMFSVYTSIKSSPEGTLVFTSMHTHTDKIYTIVRACKEGKKPSFYKEVGVHGGEEPFLRTKRSTRGKVSALHTSSIPFLLFLL